MSTRDLQSYQDHLANKVALCCKSWIILQRETLLGPELILAPHSCGSNHCPSCRADNLRRLRHTLTRTMRTDRWRLVTLTYADHSVDVESLLTSSYTRFKKLANRLRRKYPKLKYARTLELHRSGQIHHHCVFNRFIPHAFLQQAWRDLGGGIVDISLYARCKTCHQKTPCQHTPHPKPVSYKQAARYLTEEIEKIIQDPYRLGFLLWKHRVRTITVSRSLKLSVPGQAIKWLGNAQTLEEAMWWKLYLEGLYDYDQRNLIGIADGPHAIKIGPGYSDKPSPHPRSP